MVHSNILTKTSTDLLENSIELLSSIDTEDAPFLSCYLDLEAGTENCQAFLKSEAELIRAGLNEMQQLDFDEAFEHLEETITTLNEGEIRGVAIFTRSIMGGGFVRVVPSMLPFRNQLSYYRVPDIRPLLSLRDAYGEHYIVWAASDGIELFRVEGARARTLAWVAERKVEWNASEKRGLLTRIKMAKKRYRLDDVSRLTISQAVKSAGRFKLVLAGDDNRLHSLKQWLPRHLLSAVSQTVNIPDYLDRSRALRQIIDHTAAGCRAAVDAFANSCMQVPTIRRRCVTGSRNTFTAIDSQKLDALLITNKTASLVTDKQPVTLDVVAADKGQITGVTQSRFWDPGIELSRLACQKGIRVLVSNARELFRHGGVVGLLHDSTDASAITRPKHPTLTELVA